MSIRVLETVIRERLGLDPEALGSSALSRTIQARLNSGERIALEEYLELLVSNPHEIESLADRGESQGPDVLFDQRGPIMAFQGLELVRKG